MLTGTFKSSDLLTGTFKSSDLLTGTFKSSDLLTGTFKSSDFLTGTFKSSNLLTGTFKSPEMLAPERMPIADGKKMAKLSKKTPLPLLLSGSRLSINISPGTGKHQR